MDRMELITSLFLSTKKDLALLALLMGKTDKWIDDAYIEFKRKMGIGLVSILDYTNRARFNSMVKSLDAEFLNYGVRYGGKE